MSGESEIIKAICPRCAGERKAFVRGSNTVGGSEATEHGMVSWENKAQLLECCGCETQFFREARYFSEWDGAEIVYFPKAPERPRPDWVDGIFFYDDVLDHLLSELYRAADADLMVLTAIGVRTAFDRATELLGVPPEKPFEQKLDALVESGRIGAGEREVLDALVNAGSAAAHRAWKPEPVALGTMITVLESFLHRTIILEGPVKRLAGATPKKPGRRAAAPEDISELDAASPPLRPPS